MPEGLALALYATALRLLTPFYLLRLWRRGAQEALYRHALDERLGFYRTATEPGRLWIHAVSLGETRAASALITALRERDPGLRFLLTHSTATGREAGQALLQPGDAQAWLPYDTPGAVRRFLRHWRPSMGVLMETEVWPTLQRQAQKAGLPMVLANARLSEKSLRQGQRLAALMRPAARRMTLALAQTEADAARIRAMGTARVEVAGNLKYDIAMDPALIARGRAWAQQLGRPVLMLAVSREGEEKLLLNEWLRQPAPRPLLAIVPRHPQRFDEIAGLIEATGMTLARPAAGPTSRPRQPSPPTPGWATPCARCRSTTAWPASPCWAAASSRWAARTSSRLLPAPAPCWPGPTPSTSPRRPSWPSRPARRGAAPICPKPSSKVSPSAVTPLHDKPWRRRPRPSPAPTRAPPRVWRRRCFP